MATEVSVQVRSILKNKGNAFKDVTAVGNAVDDIFGSGDKELIGDLYNYIKTGLTSQNFNILERFGQNRSTVLAGSVFYCSHLLFSTHGYKSQSNELFNIYVKNKNSALKDYSDGYNLFFGKNGKQRDIMAAAKKLVSAVCKDPIFPQARVLLAHCMSNVDTGIVIVKPVATWILNGVAIVPHPYSEVTKRDTINLAKALTDRCYLLDDWVINNKEFHSTGKIRAKIDYMNEKITATEKHVLPTPMFFYHLANDFVRNSPPVAKTVDMRILDACTLYGFANCLNPKIAIPENYTATKRIGYLTRYRQQLEDFRNEMNGIIKKMEEVEALKAKHAKEELDRIQRERDEQLRLSIELISEFEQKKEAERIQNEIEMALYDRGFFKR